MEISRDKNQFVVKAYDEVYRCENIYEESELNPNEYEIVFLQSPYFKNELDYFSVKTKTAPIGFIYPLNLLAETDVDVILDCNERHFHNLADLAIRHLLVHYFSDEEKVKRLESTELHLEDLFSSDLSIFIYRKSQISNIDFFRQSLYMNGYIILSSEHPVENLYISTILKNKCANISNHRLTLKPDLVFTTFFPAFINHLYTQILPCIENPFFRYLSLYQIFELLMERTAEERFKDYSLSYIENQHSYRETKEKLSDLIKESSNIQYMHDNIRIGNYIEFSDFSTQAIKIFNLIDSTYDKNNYVHLMYKTRNTIVHNLHRLLPHQEEIKTLAELFEFTVYHFMCLRADLIQPSDKVFFVINRKVKWRANKKKMRKIYYSRQNRL